MRVPYTEVTPGLFRPLLALFVTGPSGTWLIDGLLDTGADSTLLPPAWAGRLGLDLGSLPVAKTIQSATGQSVTCKLTNLVMELRRDSTRLCWTAEVALPTDAIPKPHWGFRGFLEFFTVSFDGPNRWVTLAPGDNLPAAPTVPG